MGAIIYVTIACSAVAQSDDPNTCGRQCMEQVLSFYDIEGKRPSLEQLLPNERAPFSYADLRSACARFGLDAVAMKWDKPADAEFPVPAVLHVRATAQSEQPDHFVVCFGKRDGAYLIGAQPGVLQNVQWNDLAPLWDGSALHIGRTHDPAFESVRRFAGQVAWQLQGLAALILLVVAAAIGLILRARGITFIPHVTLATARPRAWGAALIIALVCGGIAFWIATNDPFHLAAPPQETEEPTEALFAAEPSTIQVERLVRDSAQSQLSGKARVRNRSAETLVISSVESSCSCLQIARVLGARIPPGEAIEIPFTVTAPQEGAIAPTFTVTASPGGLRTSIRVSVPDKSPLPRIVDVIGGPALVVRTASVPHAFRVVTIEVPGTDPWLRDFQCSPEEFSIVGPPQIETEPHGAYVRRTYAAEIRWRGLRSIIDQETYGEITASGQAADGAVGKRIRIAAVFTAATHPCSPSTVILSDANPDEFVFIAESDAQQWQLDMVTSPSTQFDLVREANGEHPGLRLILKRDRPPFGERCAVPLTSNLGSTASLLVVVRGTGE